LGEILLAQAEVLAHLDCELAEGLGEAGLERGASSGTFASAREQGLAKGDPDRDAAAGTPETGEDVAAVAAHDDAGNDGSAGHLGQAGYAGPRGSAFQHRTGAIANAALREDADRMAGTQAGKGDADGLPVEVGAVHGEGVDGSQPCGEEGLLEELDHAHPIDLAAGGDPEEGGIEVADVVCRKNPRALAAAHLRPQDVDFDKRCEEHFRDQPRDVVKQNPHGREAKEPLIKWEGHLLEAKERLAVVTIPGNDSGGFEPWIKNMNSPLMQFFRKALGREPALHPVDRGIARQWVKKRLAAIYPEFRNDPQALEAAYQALSLEPRLGTEEGDQAAYFEMTLPE